MAKKPTEQVESKAIPVLDMTKQYRRHGGVDWAVFVQNGNVFDEGKRFIGTEEELNKKANKIESQKVPEPIQEEKKPEFYCDICKKDLRNKKKYDKHMKLHEGEAK